MLRKIKDFKNYFVTKNGEIFRTLAAGELKRVNHSVRKKDGYCIVFLRKNKKSHARYVHRIVASAFCLKHKEDLVVNHKDGNKQNNNFKNLEWVTRKQNNEHRNVNGLGAFGEKAGPKVLTEKSAIEIFNSNAYAYALAEKYNVSRKTIFDIKHRKTWKYLHG